MFKHIKTATLCASVVLFLSPVHAYQSGDVIIRAGAIAVQPDVDSKGLAGDKERTLDVDNDTQLGLSLTYMFNNKFGIELLGASPFTHTFKGEKKLAGYTAEAKQLPPTISLQYYPRGNQSAFQPYLGLGFNYTTFYDESTKEKGKGRGKPDYSSPKLDSSSGATGQLGFDFALSDHWSLNAAIWYMDIGTTLTLTNNNANSKEKDKIDLNPWVYMAGIAYKF